MGKFAELFLESLGNQDLNENRFSRHQKVVGLLHRATSMKHYDDEDEHDYTKDEPTSAIGKELARIGKEREEREKAKAKAKATNEDSKMIVPSGFKKIDTDKGSKVRISSEHIDKAKSLSDGQSNNEHHHLVTHYTNDHPSSMHFVSSHREGDKVHFKDRYSGSHIATVNHKDL